MTITSRISLCSRAHFLCVPTFCSSNLSPERRQSGLLEPRQWYSWRLSLSQQYCMIAGTAALGESLSCNCLLDLEFWYRVYSPSSSLKFNEFNSHSHTSKTTGRKESWMRERESSMSLGELDDGETMGFHNGPHCAMTQHWWGILAGWQRNLEVLELHTEVMCSIHNQMSAANRQRGKDKLLQAANLQQVHF